MYGLRYPASQSRRRALLLEGLNVNGTASGQLNYQKLERGPRPARRQHQNIARCPRVRQKRLVLACPPALQNFTLACKSGNRRWSSFVAWLTLRPISGLLAWSAIIWPRSRVGHACFWASISCSICSDRCGRRLYARPFSPLRPCIVQSLTPLAAKLHFAALARIGQKSSP